MKNEFFEQMCSGLHGMLFEDAEEDALEAGQAPEMQAEQPQMDIDVAQQPEQAQADMAISQQPQPEVTFDSQLIRDIASKDPVDYTKEDIKLLDRYGLSK